MKKLAALLLAFGASISLQAEIQLIGVLTLNGRLLLVLRDSPVDSRQQWVEIGGSFAGYKVERYDPAREIVSLRSKDRLVEAKLVKPRVTVSSEKTEDPRAMTDEELQALGLYRMKPGDTLAKVARLHGITIPNLAVWNQITDPAKMKVGDIFFVTPPEPNKAPEPTSGTVTPPAKPGVAPVPPVAHL